MLRFWRLALAVTLCGLVLAIALVSGRRSEAVNPFRAYPPLHAGIGSPGAIVDEQTENPTFFALVKTDWPLLGIDEPRTAWEYVQRGMYRQDDLRNEGAALEDYLHALELLEHLAVEHQDPTLPERMLLLHFRLGPIFLHRGEYERAIDHFETLLHEDPELEGIHREIALAYEGLAHEAAEHGEDPSAFQRLAFEHFQSELHNGPNNQLTLYEFGHFLTDPEVHLEGVDQPRLAREMYERYLARAVEHCDTYPLRIVEVDQAVVALGGRSNQKALRNCVVGERVQ